jgi:hypothetical protein
MITDQQAEKALDFIRDHAEEYAVAKSQANQLNEYRKIKRAEIFLATTGTKDERMSKAETHPDYKLAVDARMEAEKEEARLKYLLLAAQEKLNVYRTMQANERGATR